MSESSNNSESSVKGSGASRGRPRKRRVALLGCGGLFVLFVITVFVWMQDEGPHDASDLLPPPSGVARGAGPTVLDGIIAIEAKLGNPLPTIVDDIELGGASFAWGPTAIDRTEWDLPPIREELQDFAREQGPRLDALREVTERESFGAAPLEAFSSAIPGVMESRTVAEALVLRALERRLAGDTAAASRDLALVLRLGERSIAEGGVSMLHCLVGTSLILTAWESLGSLAFDGPLDADVEAWLIERDAVFDRQPEALVNVLRYEHDVLARTLDEVPGDTLFEVTGFGGTFGRLFFKPNRTRRIAADAFRTAIDWVDLSPRERADDPWVYEQSSTWQVFISLNIGDRFIDLWVPTVEQFAAKGDECRATEWAGRTVVALVAYARKHGALPPDLETLAAATPALGGVPIDPYTGEPFLYDARRRLLWSAGSDGVSTGAQDGSLLVDGTAELFDLVDPTWIIPPLR